MAEVKSITEQEGGLSFEDRCLLAKDSLGRLWALIQEFVDMDLQYLQGGEERLRALKAGEADPVREIYAKLDTELRESYAKQSAKMQDALWANGLDFARDSYGADAVEFALLALGRERPAN